MIPCPVDSEVKVNMGSRLQTSFKIGYDATKIEYFTHLNEDLVVIIIISFELQ